MVGKIMKERERAADAIPDGKSDERDRLPSLLQWALGIEENETLGLSIHAQAAPLGCPCPACNTAMEMKPEYYPGGIAVNINESRSLKRQSRRCRYRQA
jgi:hypothetical protein